MIAVLDYGIGNLRSAEKALQHLGADARLISDPEVAAAADAVVLPGVGAFGRCAQALESSGLQQVALDALQGGKPFLGVCVGFQLLFEGSEEAPGVKGLGYFSGMVRQLPDTMKRPHMQWNRLDIRPGHTSAMLAGMGTNPWLYFVHSYAPEDGPDVVATCEYGTEVVAAVERGPVWGTQFHPEKSGVEGLALLSNFVAASTSGD